MRRLTPYVPGEQRDGVDIVKLNTNENPYPPSPQVLQTISAVTGDRLRRYPDPESTELRLALAAYHQVEINQVFVGNGSDEVLALAFMAFFSDLQPLQFPDVSYSFYPVYCDLLNIIPQAVAVEPDFTLDLQKFKSNLGGIVFPNPNAPTGLAVSLAAISELLARQNHAVVLVDEAYADFGAQSVIELIDEFPNLLVCRTFSKARSLAGLRLGAAFGNISLIEALNRVKNSFNSYPVDVLAQRAGIASLNDESYYRQTLARLVKTREHTVREFKQRDFRVLPSAANFIFVCPQKISAKQLFQALAIQGVLVRYWDREPLSRWLRISIGTENDMQQMFNVIDSVVTAP